ncbi:hypothetical protein BC831DRAFT_497796 [Entophlyctis helioformis]|nr:hypothetical protein BC831DRAFT_497796 [Entophlyctis helioformis]
MAGSAGAPVKAKARKDIWTLIKEAKDREKKAAASNNSSNNNNNNGAPSNEEAIETTLFVVGSKGAGKSSMIMRFLDRDEAPSPSVALEYTFGRRTRGVNSTKDVTHIWELAGGVFLSDLLDIPITEANIHSTTFVIVVDLADPASVLETLEGLLDKIRSRVSKILDGLEQRGSKRPKALRSYASKKYGSEHPDKDVVKLSPVPLVIVGSKYDEFKDMESEKRKLICKFLRYVAHMNGASLVFVSQKDENLVARVITPNVSHFAFRGSAIKTVAIDHNKPIVVMAGQDTLSQIGLPPSEMAKEALQKTLERVDLSKFPEPAIDAMRAQKEYVACGIGEWDLHPRCDSEELEKLRRGNDRKSKDKDALGGGLGGLVSIANSSKEKKKSKTYSRAKASQMGVA